MKYPEKISRLDKIPFYFQYFKRKFYSGINKITAKEISEDNGIRYPSGTVTTDLSTFIGNIGYKKYGYNIVALCNAFAKVMELKDPIHVAIIGESLSFIDTEELEQLNIIIKNENLDCDLLEYSMLILSQKVEMDFVRKIPENVKAIYDFSNNDMTGYYGELYQFDIASVLLELWFKTTSTKKKESLP